MKEVKQKKPPIVVKDESWKATHIFLEDLERACQHSIPTLRSMRGLIQDVQVSIRVPRSMWKRLRIIEGLTAMGLEGKNAIYVNI